MKRWETVTTMNINLITTRIENGSTCVVDWVNLAAEEADRTRIKILFDWWQQHT